MQILNNIANNNIFDDFSTFFSIDEVVFFDIETTGFSADHTDLYLIGCCYYADNNMHIIQWFNDDGESEAAILNAFMTFIKDYKYILHYNGDGFDIPYLTKKCEKHKCENPLPLLLSVDLYKELKPYKNILRIDNLKLKTVEQFLGIYREDSYTGGELISVYKNHLKKPSDTSMNKLLLHNYEDMEGLLQCFCMYSYTTLLSGKCKYESIEVKKNNLCFHLKLQANVPKRIIFSSNKIVVSVYMNDLTISVPIVEDTLKFFFDNYKDYYYLPAEDTAIHKSVSTYVDKNYRQKATKETCYTKVHGYFITQLDANIITGYKYNYKDSTSYIELSDSFLQDQDLLYKYAVSLLNKLIQQQ